MSQQPNILFLLPDQHRPDWLGNNDALPLRTPNLDRLMNRGVTFTRAYTPSPLCAPARACLASGLDYKHCRVPDNNADYPLDLPTYYQSLRDAGYRVAGVGKFDLHKDTSDKTKMSWNLDGSRLLEEWGFTEGIDNEGKLDGGATYAVNGAPMGPYLNYLCQRGLADAYVREHAERHKFKDAYLTCLPDEAYCDNWLSENGLRFLREFPAGTPWHLQVNFTGPHNPMEVTRSMHERWKNVDFPPPHANEQEGWTEEDHQRNRRHYAAMIENIDRQVGRFMETVEGRGELDNTLIVYSSDHGEMLGDHGFWGKSVYYEPATRVPLIVSGPGFRQGAVTDALVVLQDLTATFLSLAGSDPLPEMEGRSLLPVLRGESDIHRDHVVSALNRWRAVIDKRYKLVCFEDRDPVLYDHAEDPLEDTDFAARRPDVVAEMLSRVPG